MKGKIHGKYLAVCLFALLIMMLFTAMPVAAANKTGFVTTNGKTYYIKKDGSKQKGWLVLNNKKYYFKPTTGVQVKGWVYKDGKKYRYFTSGSGYMVTGYLKDSKGNVRYFDPKTGLLTRGWMKDSKGNKYYFTSGSGVRAKGQMQDSKGRIRYFDTKTGVMKTGWVKHSKGYRYYSKSTGIMYTGMKKIGSYYYYFSKANGYRYQAGFGKGSYSKYYFDPKTGRVQTGWLRLDGKKYYFNSKGVMYTDTKMSIGDKYYSFDKDGVATETTPPNVVISNGYVKVWDSQNSKYYYMEKEYLEHPGIADGSVSDRDLLAAVCESEAGDQGQIGMQAVAMCVLNSTIDKAKSFPSQIRYVVYQRNQYAVVRDGALLKRLKGNFENRTEAYKAADAAMKIFNNYVQNGTPRYLKGFDRKDFNFRFFMTPAAFKVQHLDFDKVDYYQFRGHVFFVNWVSP